MITKKRTKPSPIDEARWGLAIIEDSLWETIPKVYRRLNDIFINNMGKGLPKNFNPIEFGSWMGGDRDGNPNVTSNITKEVLLLSRWEAAKLYEKELTKLIRTYSMRKCSKKIEKLFAGVIEFKLPEFSYNNQVVVLKSGGVDCIFGKEKLVLNVR